jgi:hypothetical protein
MEEETSVGQVALMQQIIKASSRTLVMRVLSGGVQQYTSLFASPERLVVGWYEYRERSCERESE